jgi:hypothetical protein
MPELLSPDEKNEDLAEIVEDFALKFKMGLTYLIRGAYERYLSYIMKEDYADVSYLGTSIYKKHFKIVNYTKLAHKVHEKDILYVYDTEEILIITDPELKLTFRTIRGNE